MACSENNGTSGSSDSLEIKSYIKEPELAKELKEAVFKVADDLKRVGVTQVSIDYIYTGDIRIRPLGGGHEEVKHVLDALRQNLAKEHMDSFEMPLISCGNSPWYLYVVKPQNTR